MTWFELMNSQKGWIHPVGESDEPRPLVWLMAGEMTEERMAEMEAVLLPQIKTGACRPFVLAGFDPVDWDQDYAPWPFETPDGRRFGNGAAALLHFAQQTFLPEAEKRFYSDGRRFAIGYSLGGLAALYFAPQADWSGCGSCSGSLWYPAFLDWLQQHPPRCPVYLSLGGKEKNTRDPLMAQVEDCTRAAFDLLRPHTKTTFVHEPGGHFRGTAQRLSNAIVWLMNDQSRKS